MQLEFNILQKNLEEVLHESMIPYAEYVILDRALPRVEDGLKPVQRRILYTMLQLNLEPENQFRKSARIVGDCLGKYHPHGDTSVYFAMVRMAQDFSIRNPLVSGHGNFGSIDGDSPAAMRYTEAKLAPISMELLQDLEKNTVPFTLNFDDTLKEPQLLPAKFPNLLVNGAAGIAVGLATNIPPHNLTEVVDGSIAYIDNPNITLTQLMKHIKGPDFPTGGFCFGDLHTAYETGRGKVTMRAKTSIEDEEYGKKAIVITEIPYQVNKSALLEKIAKLKEDKPDLLKGIADIVDESDRNGMRAVIKIKKDYNPNEILAILFKYSDLQCTFGINLVAIADGKPKQMGLVEIIAHYIKFRKEVVYKRTKFDYDAAKDREHILEGLVVACRNIDEVIRIIRRSSNTAEAKQSLMDRFALSAIQAQAILDMRLARLTSLEVFKLEGELEDIRIKIAQLKAILDNDTELVKVVRTELVEIRKKYRDFRRTVIVEDEAKLGTPTFVESAIPSKCVIMLDKEGKLKKMTEKELSKCDENNICDCLATEGNEYVYAFSSHGNCFRISPSKMDEKKASEKGQTAPQLFENADSKEIFLRLFSASDLIEKEKLIFFTANGFVKCSKASDYIVSKEVFSAIVLKDDDKVVSIEKWQDKRNMLFVTGGGNALLAEMTEVPTTGRMSGGVRGIALDEKDTVIFAKQVQKGEIITLENAKGKKSTYKLSQLTVMARYRKGSKISKDKIVGVEI